MKEIEVYKAQGMPREDDIESAIINISDPVPDKMSMEEEEHWIVSWQSSFSRG